MNNRSIRYGELDCQVIDTLPPGTAPGLTVVFCHGFGAPGTDLVGLGPELLMLKPELAESVRFVFPAAPLSLDHLGYYGGRAWWHLDVERLMQSIERGEARHMQDELPDGLEHARTLLTGAVSEIRAETGLPTSRIVLGGFSQGAMLSTDVALHLEESPAALCLFSGTLLCQSVWKPLALRRAGLPVLISHGHQDPILPFDGSAALRDLLTDAGCRVNFVPFNGVHTIPRGALTRAADLLADLAAA